MAQPPKPDRDRKRCTTPPMEGRYTLDYATPTTMINSQDSKENVYTFYNETPSELIDDLFKGAMGVEEGDYAKACKERGGRISGMGPDCVKDKEDGEYDLTECYYRYTQNCIQELRTALLLCSEQYIKIYSTNVTVYSYGNKSQRDSLLPARECYTEAQNKYVECKEDIATDCECKSCWQDWGKPPEEGDGTTPPTTPPPTTDPEITTRRNQFTTSSNENPIPRVWGRYVVPGNIIWVGEKEVRPSTRYLGDTERIIDFTSDDVYTDFFLGVCVGEADSLLRIFFNDVLVYNKIIDLTDLDNTMATDLDLSMMASSPEDMQYLSEGRPQFILYKGSAAQKIAKKQVTKQGFGKSPAYRDLVYIHFKNMDMRLMGGSLPQIRVDLSTEIDEETNPYIEVSTDDINPKELHVDLRTNAVSYYEDINMLTTRDWSTLEHRSSVVLSEDELFAPSSYAKLITREGSHPSVEVYDPITGQMLATTYDPGAGSNYIPEVAERPNGALMMKSFKGYDPRGYPTDFTAYTTPDGGFASVTFDPSAETVMAENVYNNTTSHVPIGDALCTVDKDLHYLQFMLPPGSKTNMKVAWFRVRGGNVNQLTPTFFDEFSADSAGNFGEYQLANSAVWGTATSNVTLLNTIISHDNCPILFFKVGSSYRIVKLDPATRTVAWSVASTYQYGYWFGSGHGGKSVTQYFRFISNANDLVQLDMATGELTVLNSMTALSLPETANNMPQYYDARTNSMTYVSADERLVRAFFERLTTEDVTVKQIIDDVAYSAGLPRGFINTDALSSVTLKGFMIDKPTSMRQLLEELGEFYQFAVIDAGDHLICTFNAALDDIITLDPDRDVTDDPVRISYVAPGSRIDSIEASFYTIGPTGLEENVQTVSLRGDEVLKAPNTLKLDTMINDDPANMRKHLEMALEIARAGQNTFEATLMPRALAVTVRDQVEYNGKRYLVNTGLLSPDNVTAISGVESIADKLDDFVELNAVTLYNTVTVNRARIGRDFKPVVLFTNAVSNDDSARAQTKQVAYALIESTSTEFAATRVNVVINQHIGWTVALPDSNEASSSFFVPTSPTYTSPPISKAAHAGSLVEIPRGVEMVVFNPDLGFDEEVQVPTNRWSSDPTDRLTVRFQREDSVALLQNIAAPYYSVQETPNTNMLIVGREYIQFGTFEVDDSDPLLVTFSNLFRGTLGTEPYMTHVEGERVYLYTEDTIKPINVEARFTKRQAPARVYVTEALPAGAILADYAYKSDAGSTRPWAPMGVKVFEKAGDPTKINVSFLRRQPYVIDLMESGTNLPNDYGSVTYLLDSSDTLYSLEDFELAYMDISPQNLYEVPTDGQIVTTFEMDAPTDGDELVLILAHMGSDEEGKRVTGHPNILRIWPGNTVNS